MKNYENDFDEMLQSLNKINVPKNEKQNDKVIDIEEINNFAYLQNILECFWVINIKTLFVKNKYWWHYFYNYISYLLFNKRLSIRNIWWIYNDL